LRKIKHWNHSYKVLPRCAGGARRERLAHRGADHAPHRRQRVPAGGILGFGGELVWRKPARPGDELHIEAEIIETRRS